MLLDTPHTTPTHQRTMRWCVLCNQISLVSCQEAAVAHSRRTVCGTLLPLHTPCHRRLGPRWTVTLVPQAAGPWSWTLLASHRQWIFSIHKTTIDIDVRPDEQGNVDFYVGATQADKLGVYLTLLYSIHIVSGFTCVGPAVAFGCLAIFCNRTMIALGSWMR